MKSIKFLIIYILLIFSVSCGSEKNYNKKDRLVIWAGYSGKERIAFKKIVENFKEKYLLKKNSPKLEVYNVSFINIYERLITAAIADRLPDIVRVDTTDVPFLAHGDLALNLDQFNLGPLLKDLVPIASVQNKIAVNSSERKNYALMEQVTFAALYYNKDLFKKAGLSRPPVNLKEFIAFGKRLTDPKKGIYAFGMQGFLWWIQPWLYVHGGKVLSDDNKKILIDSNENLKALTFLKDLYSTYRIEGGAWIPGALSPENGFINERYAMVLSGPWSNDLFKNVNYGVTLIPGLSKVKSATNMGGSSYIIIKKTAHKKRAFEFIKYLLSSESQKLWVETTGELSVNNKVNKIFKNKLTDNQQNLLKQMQYIKPIPATPYYSQIKGVFNKYIRAVFNGEIDPKAMLELTSQEVNKIIMNK